MCRAVVSEFIRVAPTLRMYVQLAVRRESVAGVPTQRFREHQNKIASARQNTINFDYGRRRRRARSSLCAWLDVYAPIHATVISDPR